MKRIVVMAVAAVAVCLAWADYMPRSEWMGKVGDCAKDPSLMQETMGKLSKSDQLEFLREVNAALSKMEGSPEAVAAAFLNANRAAVMGASKDNLASVLAEVFATVPVANLPAITENFSNTLFSRNSGNSSTMSDAAYRSVAVAVMKQVVTRCEPVENANVRDAFAALMFEQASGGSPADIRTDLVQTLPTAVQAVAKSEWLPAASENNYDAMLGAAGADEEPNLETVFSMAGSEAATVALAGDLQVNAAEAQRQGGTSTVVSQLPGVVGTSSSMGTGSSSSSEVTGGTAIPRGTIYSETTVDANGNVVENPYYSGDSRGEPKPYQSQEY